MSSNSVAKFLKSYNLPQVTALILGISLEYLRVDNNSARIYDDYYSYELGLKFYRLLETLVENAKKGEIEGFSIAYYDVFDNNYPPFSQPPNAIKQEFDYQNSVFDKLSLENYLKSVGEDLNQLFELQEPLIDRDNLIEQQAKEIAELKEKLAKLERKTIEPNQEHQSSTYTTTAIIALNHVVTEHWQNWEEGKTPPKQEFIINWIMENHPNINKTTATNIDRIARHEKAK